MSSWGNTAAQTRRRGGGAVIGENRAPQEKENLQRIPHLGASFPYPGPFCLSEKWPCEARVKKSPQGSPPTFRSNTR